MICAILLDGDLGAGKTLSAVALASIWAAKAKLPLLSNMTVKGSFKIEHMEDWAKIPDFRERGSILLLDEAQSLLDSRTSQTKGQIKFTNFLQYLRKMRCLVIFTTPNFKYVDVRVRERVSYRIYVSRVGHKVVWDIFNPSTDAFIKTKILSGEKLKRFYPLYDTFELVSPVELPTDLRTLLGESAL